MRSVITKKLKLLADEENEAELEKAIDFHKSELKKSRSKLLHLRQQRAANLCDLYFTHNEKQTTLAGYSGLKQASVSRIVSGLVYIRTDKQVKPC